MKKLLFSGLLLLGSACQSVAWDEPKSQATWRGMGLRETRVAGLVASTESGAEEVHRRYERVAQAMAQAGLPSPGRPLFLVVGAEGDLLFGDAATTEATYQRWLGTVGVDNGGPGGKGQDDFTPQETEQLRECAMRMMAVEPPLDAPELALPSSWQQQFAWALVVPSDQCMDAASGRMLDIGMASAKVGWGQRLLMAPLLPMARRECCKEMGDIVTGRMLAAALRRQPDLAPSAIGSCCKALGIAEWEVQHQLGQRQPGAAGQSRAPLDEPRPGTYLLRPL